MDIYILDIVKQWDLTLCKLKFQVVHVILDSMIQIPLKKINNILTILNKISIGWVINHGV